METTALKSETRLGAVILSNITSKANHYLGLRKSNVLDKRLDKLILLDFLSVKDSQIHLFELI